MVKSFKVLVVGEGAVGKTSIAQRYTTGGFKESHLMTLGANFMLKDLKIDEETTIRLSIWDTAGQERFRKIVETYYKGASGVILTYDITSRPSFDELEYWIQTIDSKVPNIKKVVVANKVDLDSNRVINPQEGMELAKRIEASFYETSAKLNYNISEIFTDISRQMLV